MIELYKLLISAYEIKAELSKEDFVTLVAINQVIEQIKDKIEFFESENYKTKIDENTLEETNES